MGLQIISRFTLMHPWKRCPRNSRPLSSHHHHRHREAYIFIHSVPCRLNSGVAAGLIIHHLAAAPTPMSMCEALPADTSQQRNNINNDQPTNQQTNKHHHHRTRTKMTGPVGQPVHTCVHSRWAALASQSRPFEAPHDRQRMDT